MPLWVMVGVALVGWVDLQAQSEKTASSEVVASPEEASEDVQVQDAFGRATPRGSMEGFL